MWLRENEICGWTARKFGLKWVKDKRAWFAEDSNQKIRDWLAKKQYVETPKKPVFRSDGGANDYVFLKVSKKDQPTVKKLGAEKVNGLWAVKKGIGLARFQCWI